MAANANDLIKKVGASTTTTLAAPGKALSATSITVGSTTNWPTDTGITFAIRVVDSDGVLVAGTYTEWKGTVTSGTTIAFNATPEYGSDQVYAAGSTTQVFIPVSSTAHNDLVDALINEHSQLTGAHTDITATSITATTGTFTNLTIAGTASAEGWSPLGATPNTVTANGNRSYDLVFNSNDLTDTLSPGMRLKATRTVTAPTQCADLESGSSQYFSKTSPSGLSFTTTFTCSAWIKLESYGSIQGIIGRRNADTEGWSFELTTTGQVLLAGLRIASNNKYITSYQSVPLNKWVHVVATMDMAAADTSAQKIWIDGVEVPRAYTLVGTATALVQGTTALTVGAQKSAGTSPFDGKIAQAAVFSAQLSDATVKAMATQTLTGSETNLVSAFSLNNTLDDLNTGNANNLTAQNSAVATATDTPFAGGSVGTTEYGIVTAATFSTNTTLTVQVPEGYALPTTGGISAVSYSINKIPYGFPIRDDKWELFAQFKNDVGVSGASFAQILGQQLAVPIGCWNLVSKLGISINSGGVNDGYAITTLSTSTSAATDTSTSNTTGIQYVASIDGFVQAQHHAEILVNIASTTNYYQLAAETGAIAPVISGASDSPGHIKARFCYL